MESTEMTNKNFLISSSLPSIGSFTSILKYFALKQDLKRFLVSLTPTGKTFYKHHIKNSPEFNEDEY